MKKILAFILLCQLCLSPVSHAAWQSWTGVEVVLYEGSADGGRAYVTFKNPTNPGGCTNQSALTHQRIYGNNKRGEYIITTLLTAIVAGKEVMPLIQGCDDWSRPIVTGLRIR